LSLKQSKFAKLYRDFGQFLPKRPSPYQYPGIHRNTVGEEVRDFGDFISYGFCAQVGIAYGFLQLLRIFFSKYSVFNYLFPIFINLSNHLVLIVELYTFS